MSNAEQIEYWNGEAGERWAEADNLMAQLLRPVSQALIEHANLQGLASVLDVGCGGGSQSMMLAQDLDAGARVLGVDISGPMLQVAREKIEHASPGGVAVGFLQADASTHDFAADSFDLVFSRFGVMFFDDPVAAFTNLRGALQPHGRLAFSCWQAPRNNDWTWVPLQAALQHLPPPEKTDPHAPGPFAFADPERVESILSAAGFAGIEIQPFELSMRFGETPNLGTSVRELAQMGPIGRLLEDQEPAVLERVFDAMEAVLQPYYIHNRLELPGATWFVTATNGGD